MSMESHVMFRGPLPSRAAVNAMFKELNFPFAIAGRGPLEGQRGFMPMRFRREETGVEFDVFDDQDLLKEFSGQIDPAFDRTASFRWGGAEDEMLAGLCTAATMAKLLNAAVFDEAEDALLDPDGAVALARNSLEAMVARIEAEKERGRVRGTRPADIKHYLKPLLKMRPDLALVDRSLVVRPVRHVLRGAFLDRRDRYSFYLHRLLVPLYNPHFDIVQDDRFDYGREVWLDYSQPLLLDQLAEHAFGTMGEVTSLSAFAEYVIASLDKRNRSANFEVPVRAFILGGEAERAAAYLDDLERKHADSGGMLRLVKDLRAELDRDVGELCAEQHAREAKVVANLKLQSVWEPAPFPVEVPKAGRAEQCSDAPFSMVPWVAPPSWLFGEMPDAVGAPCFSEGRYMRAGRELLLRPLSPEEAERRHLAREPYELTVRLPGDAALTVKYDGQAPNDPHRNPDAAFVSSCRIELAMTTPDSRLRASFIEDWERRGRLRYLRVDRNERRSGQAFQCELDSRTGVMTSENGSGNEKSHVVLTDAEMAPHLGIDFAFGDCRGLLRRAEACALLAGLGPLSGLPDQVPGDDRLA